MEEFSGRLIFQQISLKFASYVADNLIEQSFDCLVFGGATFWAPGGIWYKEHHISGLS
jgi:hypothetical protein